VQPRPELPLLAQPADDAARRLAQWGASAPGAAGTERHVSQAADAASTGVAGVHGGGRSQCRAMVSCHATTPQIIPASSCTAPELLRCDAVGVHAATVGHAAAWPPAAERNRLEVSHSIVRCTRTTWTAPAGTAQAQIHDVEFNALAGRLPTSSAQSPAYTAGPTPLPATWPRAFRCSSWESAHPSVAACRPPCLHQRSRTSTCELSSLLCSRSPPSYGNVAHYLRRSDCCACTIASHQCDGGVLTGWRTWQLCKRPIPWPLRALIRCAHCSVLTVQEGVHVLVHRLHIMSRCPCPSCPGNAVCDSAAHCQPGLAQQDGQPPQLPRCDVDTAVCIVRRIVC
jgi:hypothetical protein